MAAFFFISTGNLMGINSHKIITRFYSECLLLFFNFIVEISWRVIENNGGVMLIINFVIKILQNCNYFIASTALVNQYLERKFVEKKYAHF